MSEQPKFRPNEPAEWKEWQETVAKKFGIEHDAEFWKIPVKKQSGEIEIHYVPKHSGPPSHEEEDLKTKKKTMVIEWDKMYIKGLGFVPREEIIEATKEIYPEMEKPGIVEAVRLLRKRKQEA